MLTADDILVPFTKEEYAERGCRPNVKGFIFAPVIPAAFANLVDYAAIESRVIEEVDLAQRGVESISVTFSYRIIYEQRQDRGIIGECHA